MILRIDGVNISFGASKVLSDVSFDLEGDGVKGLIGPNGAGKTTLFNVITGFYRVDSGNVIFDDRNITRLSSHAVVKAGVARTFQKPSLSWDRTVFENVLLGTMNRRDFGLSTPRSRLKEWTEECLSICRVPPEAWQEPAARVGILGIKKTELARAVALSPKLVLLDEICSGLSHDETDELLEVIKDFEGGRQCGVLFVEHDLRAIQIICKDVVVLDFGVVIYNGDVKWAFTDRRVVEAYIGGGDA
jgi:branched-chain amino acid transport system ATP-binding protein